MSSPNPILTAANAALPVTNLYGATNFPNGRATLDALPLGTASNSPTGEIGLKVHVVSGGSTPAAVTLTPVSTTINSSGTVAAGKVYIEFILDVSWIGTINGVAYNGATDGGISFVAPSGGSFSALSYVWTAGTARLITY